jgi:hypothetical protein
MHEMPRSMLGAAIAIALTAGCGEDQTSAQGVVESVDGRSAVDTLIALVSLRDAATGSTMDASRLERVRWRVDDRAWGTFEVGEPDPNTVGEALVIAELGRELERTEDPLDTIAEWRSLLDAHLAPGGHVAELEVLWIDGQMIEPHQFIAFDIEQGDATAYLGGVEVDVSLDGGRK